jgi:hypothetical protein
MSLERNTCFIIMPFGGDFDDYYSLIYKPAIESLGIKPLRADDLFRPSTIISDIWEMINSSKIILADLSTLNANVMYELGLAHAIAKPVIILSESIDTIPFDLRGLRILTYNKNKPNWSEKLSKEIQISITETLNSPLESILPTFLTIKPTKSIEINQITNDLLEIKQLLHQQLNSDLNSGENQTSKTLSRKDFVEASEEARKLYYESGYEIQEIRKHLSEKYGISYERASKIFGRSLW